MFHDRMNFDIHGAFWSSPFLRGKAVSVRQFWANIISSAIGAIASASKKSPKAEPKWTPQQLAAQSFLERLYGTGVPDYPTAPVAGLSEKEQQAGKLTSKYANSEPEGMDYLRKVMGSSDSITDIPEYKALLDEILKAGSDETNRVGRSLQMRGGATSSTGRDALGQSVNDVMSNALATLAPYAASLRNEKMSAANVLSSLGESSTLNRLNALSEQGALERQLEQLRQQADYEREMKELNFPYTTQAPLAMGILGTQPNYEITGGDPSLVTQLAPFISQLGGAFGNTSARTAAPRTAAPSQLASGATDWLDAGVDVGGF